MITVKAAREAKGVPLVEPGSTSKPTKNIFLNKNRRSLVDAFIQLLTRPIRLSIVWNQSLKLASSAQAK